MLLLLRYLAGVAEGLRLRCWSQCLCGVRAAADSRFAYRPVIVSSAAMSDFANRSLTTTGRTPVRRAISVLPRQMSQHLKPSFRLRTCSYLIRFEKLVIQPRPASCQGVCYGARAGPLADLGLDAFRALPGSPREHMLRVKKRVF